MGGKGALTRPSAWNISWLTKSPFSIADSWGFFLFCTLTHSGLCMGTTQRLGRITEFQRVVTRTGQV